MIGQAFDLGPRYSVILAAQQICRLRASVKIAMRATEGPYLGKAVLEWKRGATPSNHLCKGRISGGPLIHLAGGETRQLPGCPAVFRTPDPRPMPVTAAPSPDQACFCVTDHVVDWPAVTMWARHFSTASLTAAFNQKGAFRGSNEDRNGS